MKKEYAQYLLTKTKKDYSLIARDFSRTRKHPWQEIRFLFRDYLISKDKVLDLGCGNGRYLPFFKEKSVDYFGIDNCQELIEIAKKKYSWARFQTGNALNLPFSNNFFDKVYSIAVLHQIPSQDLRTRFLQEVKRILKPKGLLVLTVWRFHRSEELRLLLKYTLLKLVGKSNLDWRDVFVPWGGKTERYYHFFSIRELERLIKKNGLKVLKFGIVKNKKGNRRNIYIVAEKP